MNLSQFLSDSVTFIKRRLDKVPPNLNSTHCHDKYEILYVSEGKGKYTVEGVEYPVRPRTLMIFPPLTHHCVTLEEGIEYERVILYFDSGAVADCAKHVFDSIVKLASGAGAFYAADSIFDGITAVFDRFEKLGTLPEQEREPYARLLLSELLLLLSAAKREDFTYDDGELGARVIKYLNDNMDRELSLEKLAKRFFVSKYYLCRAFKKYNGISIHGYITKKRVMYAKQLIESGETASGAAYRVGFGDYSAFYRAYVKLVGRAPTQTEEREPDEL